jgi:hypothetical protein
MELMLIFFTDYCDHIFLAVALLERFVYYLQVARDHSQLEKLRKQMAQLPPESVGGSGQAQSMLPAPHAQGAGGSQSEETARMQREIGELQVQMEIHGAELARVEAESRAGLSAGTREKP